MKKLISLALCGLILCCTATTTVFGENEGVVPNANSYVEARYAEFSMVYASLSKTSLGFYHVEGSAGTYDNDLRVDITLIMSLLTASSGLHPTTMPPLHRQLVLCLVVPIEPIQSQNAIATEFF